METIIIYVLSSLCIIFTCCYCNTHEPSTTFEDIPVAYVAIMEEEVPVASEIMEDNRDVSP